MQVDSFIYFFLLVSSTISKIFNNFFGQIKASGISVSSFMLAFVSFSLFMRFILGSGFNAGNYINKSGNGRDQRRRTQKK